MINKCGPVCPEEPRKPTPIMPPIEPLVSVKSVNGLSGEVVLPNATQEKEGLMSAEDKTKLDKGIVLENAITSKVTIGGITEGDVFEAGTSIEEILRKLLG